MPDETSINRKILSRPRGDVISVQMRIRAEMEPDLFDLVLNLRSGVAANFLRSALDHAYRLGALTPHGFSLDVDDTIRSLQVQLRLAKEDITGLQERNRLLLSEIDSLRNGEPTQPLVQVTQRPQPLATIAMVTPTPVARPALPTGFAAALRSSQGDAG